MKVTIKAHAKQGGFPVECVPGLVQFDGMALLPHEAAMLALALEGAAERAESMAADAAAVITWEGGSDTARAYVEKYATKGQA